MTTARPTPGPRPPAPRSAVACVGCGYDLRAADPAGGCPECGTSVAASIAATRSPYGSATRKVAVGWRMLASGFAGLAAVNLWYGAGLRPYRHEQHVAATLAILLWVPTLLVLLGMWRVTAGETWDRAGPRWPAAIPTRALLIVWALIWFGLDLDLLSGGAATPRWLRPFDEELLGLASASASLGLFCLWWFAGHATRNALPGGPFGWTRWFPPLAAAPHALLAGALAIEGLGPSSQRLLAVGGGSLLLAYAIQAWVAGDIAAALRRRLSGDSA